MRDEPTKEELDFFEDPVRYVREMDARRDKSLADKVKALSVRIDQIEAQLRKRETK